MAMGCSTNAVIHVLAMARRAGHDIGLEDFDAASRKVPVIANIRPSGDKYLMEDFYYAGGLLGLMSRLKAHLDLDQINVTGETWAQEPRRRRGLQRRRHPPARQGDLQGRRAGRC